MAKSKGPQNITVKANKTGWTIQCKSGFDAGLTHSKKYKKIADSAGPMDLGDGIIMQLTISEPNPDYEAPEAE